jgi:uncharacterized protein with HEPN domain
MYKKDIGFLFAILKMCDDIESYKKDYNNLEDILNERIGLNACLMNITQIGEYSGKLSEEFTKEFCDVEWRKIKGLRNIIVHDYLGVDIEKIEKILENQIPELIKNILKIIDELVNSSRISKQLIEASSKDFKTITLDNFFA